MAELKMPTPGRILHYVMKDGTLRPLHVTHAFGGDNNMVNGILMLDGSNDRKNDPAGDVADDVAEAPLMRWVGSCSNVEPDGVAANAPGTWRWPVAA